MVGESRREILNPDLSEEPERASAGVRMLAAVSIEQRIDVAALGHRGNPVIASHRQGRPQIAGKGLGPRRS